MAVHNDAIFLIDISPKLNVSVFSCLDSYYMSLNTKQMEAEELCSYQRCNSSSSHYFVFWQFSLDTIILFLLLNC